MTERGLYVSCIPEIAEIAVRCRKMPMTKYEDWKQEVMEHCMEHCPETAKEFMCKVMMVIDKYVLERV